MGTDAEDEAVGATEASIFALLLATAGVDFRPYKSATRTRRLEHRCSARGCTTLEEYLALLENDAGERHVATDALLIKTTSMFRDAATFAVLRTTALPQLVRARARGRDGQPGAVRAWVPACATGEEAYSLAMCLLEARDAAGVQLDVSVLASDIDRAAIERVGRGTLSPSSIDTVPPEIAARYLTRHESHYEVVGEARAVVSSSHHDLLASSFPAPRESVVASFDLVSCRNVLIYFNRDAQDAVFSRLLKTCARDALLVFGEAERPPMWMLPELEPVARHVPVYWVRR